MSTRARIRLFVVVPVVAVVVVLSLQHHTTNAKQQAFDNWGQQYGIPMSHAMTPLFSRLGGDLTALAQSSSDTHVLSLIDQDCSAGKVEFRSADRQPLPPEATVARPYVALRLAATALFATCLQIFHDGSPSLLGNQGHRFDNEIRLVSLDARQFSSQVVAESAALDG